MYLVTIRVTICHRLSGLGRDLSRSGPYFGVRAGCRCSHLDPPANGQAVIHLTGLLEVFISELSILFVKCIQPNNLRICTCGPRARMNSDVVKGQQVEVAWQLKKSYK